MKIDALHMNVLYENKIYMRYYYFSLLFSLSACSKSLTLTKNADCPTLSSTGWGMDKEKVFKNFGLKKQDAEITKNDGNKLFISKIYTFKSVKLFDDTVDLSLVFVSDEWNKNHALSIGLVEAYIGISNEKTADKAIEALNNAEYQKAGANWVYPQVVFDYATEKNVWEDFVTIRLEAVIADIGENPLTKNQLAKDIFTDAMKQSYPISVSVAKIDGEKYNSVLSYRAFDFALINKL